MAITGNVSFKNSWSSADIAACIAKKGQATGKQTFTVGAIYFTSDKQEIWLATSTTNAIRYGCGDTYDSNYISQQLEAIETNANTTAGNLSSRITNAGTTNSFNLTANATAAAVNGINAGNITTNASAIKALSAAVDSNSTKITNIGNGITAIATAITSIGNTATKNAQNIESLTSIYQELKTSVDTNTTTITNIGKTAAAAQTRSISASKAATAAWDKINSITAGTLGLANALHFLGVANTTSSLYKAVVSIDGTTGHLSSITITKRASTTATTYSAFTPTAGDVIIDGSTDNGQKGKEYIYNGSEWEELGDESSYVTITEKNAVVGTLDTLGENIDSLQSQVNTNTSNIDSIGTGITAQATALAELQIENTNAQNLYKSVSGAVNTLKGQYTAAYKQGATNSFNLTANTKKIDDNAKTITTNAAGITTLFKLGVSAISYNTTASKAAQNNAASIATNWTAITGNYNSNLTNAANNSANYTKAVNAGTTANNAYDLAVSVSGTLDSIKTTYLTWQ